MRKLFTFIIIFLFFPILLIQTVCLAEKPPYEFNQEIKINDDEDWTNKQGGPSIAIYENIVYITWFDERNDTKAVYFSKSIDGGENFTEGKKIDGLPHSLKIIVGSTGIIYAVFYNAGNISFTKSTDGGESFTNPIKVNDEQSDGLCSNPEIAVDMNDNIYVVWEDTRNHLPLDKSSNFDIYFARLVCGEEAFGPNIRVNNDISIAHQLSPGITVSKDGDVYVVWTDERNDHNASSYGVDWDIYFAKSMDGGESFYDNVMVSNDTTYKAQASPNIATDNSGNIYVIWLDIREGQGDENGTDKAYFSRSTNGGLSFESDLFVASGSGGLIAADDKGVYIIVKNRLVYSKDGKTFSETMTVTPFNNCPSSIILDNQSNIYITWTDYRSGYGDIYFKKGIRTEPSNENGNNIQNQDVNDNWSWIIIAVILIVCVAGAIYLAGRRRAKMSK